MTSEKVKCQNARSHVFSSRIVAAMSVPSSEDTDADSQAENLNLPPETVCGFDYVGPNNRLQSFWYQSTFPWFRDAPQLSWWGWCISWERKRKATIWGLFSQRIFVPSPTIPGYWVLDPMRCCECSRLCGTPDYWYGVCSSCWAVGTEQLWRFLEQRVGGPVAQLIWSYGVAYPRGAVDTFLPMLNTLLDYDTGLDPRFVNFMRFWGPGANP